MSLTDYEKDRIRARVKSFSRGEINRNEFTDDIEALIAWADIFIQDCESEGMQGLESFRAYGVVRDRFCK